jgi:hypothetical protein
MSRFGRIRRRPDHWASAHERARARAAERLDGPLGLAEATWLDEHLAGCPACAAIAAAYETDRQSLHAMRGAMPEPPRDLWARTAAAIEQESGGRRGAAPRRSQRVPLGALSGLAVVAVVVGVSTMSSGLFTGAAPTDQDSEAARAPDSAAPLGAADGGSGEVTAEAAPTPIAVGAGQVKWVDLVGDGSLAYNAADVDEVCPAELQEGCATVADDAAGRLSLAAAPEAIIATPNERQAIVVSRDASGAQQLLVVDLPPPTDATEAASPDPAPTDVVAQSPAPSSDPGGTPDPAASAAPSDDPAATSTPASPEPSADALTSPSPDPLASPDPAESPAVSPEASLAARLPIASDIEIVGQSAAFSDDGEWFAFTARAVGDEGGSNVYLWKVGEDDVQPLTSDGLSSFASWSGDQVVVSRVEGMGDTSVGQGEDDPFEAIGSTVTIDPSAGTEIPTSSSWRPAVDPTQTRAIVWNGTLRGNYDGEWHPAEGRLELQSWPDPSDGTSQVVAEGAMGDFDIRWDDEGEWFAVWIAEVSDPTIGRLSLLRIDPATGELVRPAGAPTDVPALPGFSIGDGRLAWATPPGQGGEGSRVLIVAWKGDGVGSIETAPGEALVVIR